MVINDVTGGINLKKDLRKVDSAPRNKESSEKKEISTSSEDSVELTNTKLAVEKENILASKNSIEDFEHAKSILSGILNSVDEKNILEIHGNADKVKSFLVM